MILSAQTLRETRPLIVVPFFNTKTVSHGMSFGLSHAGYDIRVAQHLELTQAAPFVLASSLERFQMPNDVLAVVHDKSSWARKGLFVNNTVIEPGWEGFLTLELSYRGNDARLVVEMGAPIAQIVFHRLDFPTDTPYVGKYQNQPDRPVKAIEEQARG